MKVLLVSLCLAVVKCNPVTESYKDQYCTDPRTSHRHAAYTEWADAYSCTRHRCQPGGRNLAIYTVGCKRVEAPESAIECEEVVEDTNMQFPFCCTRLRCLVVVRGEVWTRVLGQPWETLPAAPWSHMYKMKKPPPGDVSFGIKTPEQGPVYELTESDSDGPREKVQVLRASKATTDGPGCNDAVQRAAAPPPPPPDIVIALSTNTDPKAPPVEKINTSYRHKRIHGDQSMRARDSFFDDEKEHLENDAGENENHSEATEKPQIEPGSDERFYGNGYAVTQKASYHQPWTDIPQNQWNENDPGADTDSIREPPYNQQDIPEHKPEEKPANLQALVDAIGSRMRDIEHVVQRMSEKVHAPGDEPGTAEKGDTPEDENHKLHKKEYWKPKRPGPDQDHYKRFSVRNRGTKYVHTTDTTTDIPLFVKESGLSGYFSDASNSVLRRSNGPKEPTPTYMAPVETRRKALHAETSEEKKKKKHLHKKKKGKHHKKHHNKKKFNRVSSSEDKNLLTQEDSSDAGA